MTKTQEYARNLRRDPIGKLVAIATRHAGEGLRLSSRSALAEGSYLIASGESPYYARRAILRAIELRCGKDHPDTHLALALVRQMDAADGAVIGVAA